jgi:hypothetical protein
MNKKRFLIMFLILVVIGLIISTYQYVETMKTDVASAAQTIPNPGHSWSSMESGPDSIQVTGKTITNLATPVASTDAVNKAYVDAAGGGTYTACYVLSSASNGVACASGYTSIAHYYGGGTSWTVDNPNGATNATSFIITIGGGTRVVRFSFCHSSWTTAGCYDNFNGGRANASGYGTSSIYPAISIDNLIDASTMLGNATQTYAFCCK